MPIYKQKKDTHFVHQPLALSLMALNVHAFNNLHTCVLKPIWAEAMASGAKAFEVQRYKGKYMNSCNFAHGSDGILMVGAKGCQVVQCIANIDFPIFKCTRKDMEPFARDLPEHLQEAFQEYLDEGTVFDLLFFEQVIDLRPLGITWKEMEEKLGVSLPRNGRFPAVKFKDDKQIAEFKKICCSNAAKRIYFNYYYRTCSESDSDSSKPPRKKQRGGKE